MGLRVGMGPPYTFSAVIEATPDFPTADITSGSFEIVKPNGSRVAWPAAIVSQSSSSITLEKDLAPGDLDLVGRWIVYARGQVPGGEVRTEPASFQVGEEF